MANFPSVRLIFGYKTSNPDCSRTHHNSWITTVLHWFSPFPSTLGCREAATCVQSCSFLQFGHKRQFGPLLGLSKRLPPLFGQHCPQFILLQNMQWKVASFGIFLSLFVWWIMRLCLHIWRHCTMFLDPLQTYSSLHGLTDSSEPTNSRIGTLRVQSNSDFYS